MLLEGTRPIRSLFLTVDLTEPVLAEALEHDADLIVSYHPPIFSGLKALTASSALGRTLLRTIRAGVGVYSPHTALDAAAGGMNDWLLEAFSTKEARPIEASATDPGVGFGRVADLSEPTALDALVPAVKRHLGLAHLRLAAHPDLAGGTRLVSRVAVCPGAGGSVLSAARDADLVLTGEMRHHDVLARVSAGGAVLLTDHTNTERGYLPTLARRLERALDVSVRVSALDADPLAVL